MYNLRDVRVIVGAKGQEFQVDFNDRYRGSTAEPLVGARLLVDGRPTGPVKRVLYTHALQRLKESIGAMA